MFVYRPNWFTDQTSVMQTLVYFGLIFILIITTTTTTTTIAMPSSQSRPRRSPSALQQSPELQRQLQQQYPVRSPSEWRPFHLIRVVTAAPVNPPVSGGAVLVDGVPLDKLPPRLVVAAYVTERRRMELQRGEPHDDATSKGRTERPKMLRASAGLDATAYCTTDECVQMMQEYEEWRLANGYGTSGGRWG